MKAFKGCIFIGQKTYHYEGEQYSAASKYGIDGGRIKKLTIKLKGKVIVSYDKRWIIEPSTVQTVDALDIIKYDYNWYRKVH